MNDKIRSTTWMYFADNYALFGALIYFSFRFLWAGRIIIGIFILIIPVLIILLSYRRYEINNDIIIIKSIYRNRMISLLAYDRISFRSAGLWTGQFVGIIEGTDVGLQKILLPRNKNKRTLILKILYDLDLLIEADFLERHDIK